MLALGIDTTGGYCSVALVDAARVLACNIKKIGTGHAGHLGLMVDNVLAGSEKNIKQIGRIVICTGPGSFTGVRVGLALAKGLALPYNISQIGISALEVWARMQDPEGIGEIISVADVRRGEIFWQKFVDGKALVKPELSSWIKSGGAELTGTGAILFGGKAHDGFVDPRILAWLGMSRPAEDNLMPLYHRPPDAKLPKQTQITSLMRG